MDPEDLASHFCVRVAVISAPTDVESHDALRHLLLGSATLRLQGWHKDNLTDDDTSSHTLTVFTLNAVRQY